MTAIDTKIQHGPDGKLRHLITLEGLSAAQLTSLLDLAQFYVRMPGELPARDRAGADDESGASRPGRACDRPSGGCR